MIGINIRSFETDQGFTFVATSYEKFEVRTNKHGDGSLQIIATVGRTDAHRLLFTRDERYVIVTSNGVPIFRGVIHDITVNGYTVDIVAFGAWGAMVSVPISGIWSHTIPQEWRELPVIHDTYYNERYSVDNDGRLYIGLKGGEEYHDAVLSGWFFERPHYSVTPIQEFSFSYDVTLPSGYIAQVRSALNDNSNQTVEWQVAGNGAQQTGSANLTSLTNPGRLIFTVSKTGTTPTTYTDETDEFYAYIDALRVKGTASLTVDSSEIVADIWSYLQTQNPNVFQQGISAAEMGLDLQDVLYEDAAIGSIVEGIEDAGDLNSEPLIFNIDRYGFANLAVRAEYGETWFADIVGLEATTTLDGYANNLYARYEDSNKLVRRTAPATAKNDLAPGFVLADFVDYRTTSESEAEAVRDAYLEYASIAAIKAKIAIANVRPGTGDRIGLEFVRGGDRLVINNAPFSFQKADHRMFYFDILDTTYDGLTNTLQVTLGSGNFDQRDAVVDALVGEFDYVQI